MRVRSHLRLCAAALLAADVALSADGEQHAADTPSLTLGYRGAVALSVRVRTAAADLHSGSFGGSVGNAAHVLSAILAALHGPDGAVAAPAFYADVAVLSAEERAALAAVPHDDAADKAAAGALGQLPVLCCAVQRHHCLTLSTSRHTLGVSTYFGEEGFTTLERRWCAPPLPCHSSCDAFLRAHSPQHVVSHQGAPHGGGDGHVVRMDGRRHQDGAASRS